jgi:signal transduction histidine kinase/ActR/RegA family two-component response regulator
LVSLVDAHRQWFKSHHGIDASETARNIAFCAHVVASRESLVVPDSTQDARFFDNPLVTGAPYVRFYVGTPLIGPNGHTLGTLCGIDQVPRTVTPRQLEALRRLGGQVINLMELRRARDAALKAALAKSEFLATMSHEIRTPLSGVLGMTELLLESPLSAEQRGLAATVKACGEHLLAVVNDVLDFSKLESGKLALECVEFDVAEIVAQCAAICRCDAVKSGIALTTECAADLGRRMGDPTRLRQALLNLCTNAVKFTLAGAVGLRVESAAGSTEIAFFVTDSGIGIAADKISGLFERFSQADSSTTRRFGGSGLGLAITRRIVELMGGQIGVASEIGVGSTFSFRVPMPLAAATATVARPDAATTQRLAVLKDLRVLVADDNSVNRLLIRRQLLRFGCQTTIVESGREAIEQWNASPFDVILMDCQMPQMDGYEATRRIRASASPGAQIPIIALTANALESDRDNCLRAGMSDFLTKPVALDRLQDALSRAAMARTP